MTKMLLEDYCIQRHAILDAVSLRPNAWLCFFVKKVSGVPKKMELEQVVGRIDGVFGVRIIGRFSSWNLFSIFPKSETQTNNNLKEYFSVNYYALNLTCFRESSISCI